ncbi:hypothetical protein CROQUDRAFT_446728 [Cronartium quercuum f. sp. fusiforme G11]|uniref:Uncharacterized protein n=1 Tax=Cronartium quercuum f. sp. fusiforme G11 TaxID=708437 RepID=A0A9P6N674_9BASI|nr:hypothetical protein CROQUDRAFT_446728 [Cronartium quercuum f. sp. fusiforme G11]
MIKSKSQQMSIKNAGGRSTPTPFTANLVALLLTATFLAAPRELPENHILVHLCCRIYSIDSRPPNGSPVLFVGWNTLESFR